MCVRVVVDDVMRGLSEIMRFRRWFFERWRIRQAPPLASTF